MSEIKLTPPSVPASPADARRSYVRPTVTKIGNVRDVTLAVARVGADFAGKMN